MFCLRSTAVDFRFCPITLVFILEFLCPGHEGDCKNKAGEINSKMRRLLGLEVSRGLDLLVVKEVLRKCV